MQAFFGLVQPLKLLKRFPQDDVSFGRSVLHFQSPADHFLRLARPSCLAQEVAVSELRLGVPPAAEIDGRLKSFYRFIRVAQRRFRHAHIVVGLEIIGECLASLCEVAQTPRWIILRQPLQPLLELLLRLAGDFQLPHRNRVTALANRPRSAFQVHDEFRGGTVELRTGLGCLVSLFIYRYVVGTSRKVLHSETPLEVRQNTPNYSGNARFQLYGYLGGRPLVRLQKDGSRDLAFDTLKAGHLRLRARRPR